MRATQVPPVHIASPMQSRVPVHAAPIGFGVVHVPMFTGGRARERLISPRFPRTVLRIRNIMLTF